MSRESYKIDKSLVLIARSSPPDSPELGEMYFDSTSGIQVYDGSLFQSVATQDYVDTAVAGAGGANTTLSNLTSPTSVNQDLIFQSNKKITNINDVLVRKTTSEFGAPIEIGTGSVNTGSVLAAKTNATGSAYVYLTNGTHVSFFGLDGLGLQNFDPGSFLAGTLSANAFICQWCLQVPNF